MITNPKDFFQQIQNFVEEVALKIKAINGSISAFLTKSEAEATYLEKVEASNTYLGKSDKAASATVADSATSASKATNDANGNDIGNTYLTKTDAASTYLSKTDASSTYLGKTAKAASATTADSATRATQDSDGNNIAQTYVKTVNNVAPVNGNVNVDIALTKDKVTSALGYTPLQTAPVTSVNGKTGAVTIDKVNNAGWADGAWSATVTPSVVTGATDTASGFTLPSGGTWAWMASGPSDQAQYGGTAAGGTKIRPSHDGTVSIAYVAIRVA